MISDEKVSTAYQSLRLFQTCYTFGLVWFAVPHPSGPNSSTDLSPPIARATHETSLSKYGSFEFMWRWGEKISKPLKMGAMSFCGCGFRTTPHIGAGAIALPKNEEKRGYTLFYVNPIS